MDQRGSNRKGNRFENLVAKSLSKWSDSNIIRNQFTRTGDMFTQPSFPFGVECKHHAQIPFARYLWSSAHLGNWGEFWNQCKRDAEALKKKPMLVFKENRGTTHVAFAHEDFLLVESVLGPWRSRRIDMWIPNQSAAGGVEKVVILAFEEFLEWADYEAVAKHLSPK